MNKYLLSKIAFTFFSITTIAPVVLLYMGGSVFIDRIGIETAVVFYALNTFFLVISAFVYVWQRSHKDSPSSQKTKTLEAWAEQVQQDAEEKRTNE